MFCYVIYDLRDNLIAYLDDISELSLFTGLRIKDINYKFNISKNDCILYFSKLNNRDKKNIFKIYRFVF